MNHAIWLRAAAAILGCLLLAPVGAQSPLPFVYLLPAPQFLAAFAPFNVAQRKGYYQAEGLAVEFRVARGGADVASRLHRGDGDAGGGTGDTAILMRPASIPVRAIALLGAGSLYQLVIPEDARIYQPLELKGKRVSVVSTTDSSYYVLLGFLRSVGLSRNDVRVEPGGPVGVFRNVIEKKADLMIGVPDWIPPFHEASVGISVMKVGRFFPNMAQAIIATDERIRERPEALRSFVKATLAGFKDVLADPESAGELMIAMFPQHKARPGSLKETVVYYAKNVYPGQFVPGEIDDFRLSTLQDFYVEENIIPRATPLAELYTNQFVLCADCPEAAGVRADRPGPLAANQAKPAAPARATSELKELLAQRTVYFDFDSAEIKPQFQAIVEAHGKHLAANPARRVRVLGHTDIFGVAEYNRALGQKRADNLKQALIAAGADEAQVTTAVVDAAQGVAREPTPWQNRRAEIVY